MAIGSPLHDSEVGCVFVYFRETLESLWRMQSNRLIGTTYEGKPRQGSCVSLSDDGNTLAIGGPYDNDGTGAVWMFKRSDGLWYQTQEKIVSLDVDGKKIIPLTPQEKFFFTRKRVFFTILMLLDPNLDHQSL